MESDRSMSRRQYIARLVVTLSGLGALVVAFFVAVLVGLGCTDGDGGVPYVARDSSRASACDATGDGFFLTLVLLIAALALLVLVYRLGAAWASRSRGPAAFFGLALVVALLPAGTSLAMAPFSPKCSPEKEATWSEYNRTGEGLGADLDCAVY